MTEVTESTPEDSGKTLQSGKREKKLPKPDKEDKRRAPSSGQAEQRDATIGRQKSGK